MLAYRRSVRSSSRLGFGLLLLVGCPGNAGTSDPTATAGTTASPTTAPSTSSPSTSTSAPTSTGASTSTSSTTTTGTPLCPNGNVDEGETCDDGNGVNGDGCNNDCTKSAEILHEYRSGEPGHDAFFGIASDGDGVIVGGHTGGSARVVARFDLALMQQWSATYGDASIGIVTGVALARGAIYAAGAVFSDVDGHDIWLARLAPDGGALEWEDVVSSGFGNDYLNQVALTEGGDIVVTGLASIEGGETAVWTRRYGPDGNPKWTAPYPLAEDFNIYPLGPGLVVTPEAIVVGWTLPSGNAAHLLIAYPHDGSDLLWSQLIPETSGTIKALARDPAGDLVVVGKVDIQFSVHRATSSGVLLWSSYDCTGTNGRDVAVDSLGDIVVIGDGPGGTGVNIRLCKFAPDGKLRWGKDIEGGFGDDYGWTVAIGPSDQIIAGGSVHSEQGNNDAWLAVLSP